MALEFGRRHGFFNRLSPQQTRPEAFVSQGRWVINCTCGNGPSASPEWELAVCLECGKVWQPVFPDRRELLETVLLSRERMANRNWEPAESVDALLIENADNDASVRMV